MHRHTPFRGHGLVNMVFESATQRSACEGSESHSSMPRTWFKKFTYDMGDSATQTLGLQGFLPSSATTRATSPRPEDRG